MRLDFSHINFEYLVQARDLAREDTELTAVLLDSPLEVIASLASTTPSDLLYMTEIKAPLLMPRCKAWWWLRFLQAIRDGDTAEIKIIIDQASLLAAPVEPSVKQ